MIKIVQSAYGNQSTKHASPLFYHFCSYRDWLWCITSERNDLLREQTCYRLDYDIADWNYSTRGKTTAFRSAPSLLSILVLQGVFLGFIPSGINANLFSSIEKHFSQSWKRKRKCYFVIVRSLHNVHPEFSKRIIIHSFHGISKRTVCCLNCGGGRC